MKQGSRRVLNNQGGFTLIELIMVIVILGILAVVAIPKYADIQEEAADAAAEGVYGAAQGAAAINFATFLVNSTKAPAGSRIRITDGDTLMDALDGDPEGWTASGMTILNDSRNMTYTITVTEVEDVDSKAVLELTKTATP